MRGSALAILTLSASATTAVASRPFYDLLISEKTGQPFGATIWVSNVNTTVFGEDAANFDYELRSDPEAAIEAVHLLAEAITGGDEHHIMTTFLNTTQAGTMTEVQAAHTTWLCRELGPSQMALVPSCKNVDRDAEVVVQW